FLHTLLDRPRQRAANGLGRRQVELILRKDVLQPARVEGKARQADRRDGVAAKGEGASDADRHARNAPGVKRALKSISPGNQVERFVVGKIEHFAVNRFGRGPQQLEILIGEVFNIAEGFQSGRASDVKVETA